MSPSHYDHNGNYVGDAVTDA
jgi:hypothetical protein